MSIKIVTDSTCDLPRELIHAHHISVIPLHINKGEDLFLCGKRRRYLHNSCTKSYGAVRIFRGTQPAI